MPFDMETWISYVLRAECSGWENVDELKFIFFVTSALANPSPDSFEAMSKGENSLN